MKKLAVMLATLLLPVAGFADGTVAVSSLEVKERIRSIEQINVTAEKEPADIAPESQRVADILRELDEAEDKAEQPSADERHSD